MIDKFEQLKDLITKTRQITTEESIKQPTLILSEGWSWLLEDEHSLEFLKRATRAIEIKFSRV